MKHLKRNLYKLYQTKTQTFQKKMWEEDVTKTMVEDIEDASDAHGNSNVTTM